MEVGQREQQLAVLLLTDALVEGLLRDAGLVQTRKVGSETLGRFRGHLQPAL